jgi:hypothetical protein
MVGKAWKVMASLSTALAAYHDPWNNLCCEGREKALGALGSFDTASSAFPWAVIKCVQMLNRRVRMFLNLRIAIGPSRGTECRSAILANATKSGWSTDSELRVDLISCLDCKDRITCRPYFN